jgi:uncharacterized Zn-finger protein
MSTQIMLRRTDHPAPDGLPPPEVKLVTAWNVSCDGGEGALGHPRVWLTIPREQGYVDCGYCDARFVHQDSAYAQAQLANLVPGQPLDHATPADLTGEVRGKQPGGDSSDPLRGNDGGSGERHGS